MLIPLGLGYIPRHFPIAIILIIIINCMVFVRQSSTREEANKKIEILNNKYEKTELITSNFVKYCAKKYEAERCDEFAKYITNLKNKRENKNKPNQAVSSEKNCETSEANTKKEDRARNINWKVALDFELLEEYHKYSSIDTEVDDVPELQQAKLQMRREVSSLQREYDYLSKSNINIKSVFNSLFSHVDVVHLSSNLLFLALFGIFVEAKIGTLVFLIFYTSIGILSKLLTIHFQGSSSHLVGASDAIYGIAAFYYMLFFKDYLKITFFYIARKSIYLKNNIWFPIYFLTNEVVLGFSPQSIFNTSGVSHIGHAFGIVCGLVVGYICKKYVFVPLPNGFHFENQLSDWASSIKTQPFAVIVNKAKYYLSINPKNQSLRFSLFKKMFAMENFSKAKLVDNFLSDQIIEYCKMSLDNKDYKAICELFSLIKQDEYVHIIFSKIDPHSLLYIAQLLYVDKKLKHSMTLYEIYRDKFPSAKNIQQILLRIEQLKSDISSVA